MQQESIFIPLENGKLHLKRIYQNENGKPVFLLHGSIENGKIFYSNSLKGFAPYLAQKGFDVFVVDMQGRGLSTPAMSKKSKYGQIDVIKTDIPLCLQEIKKIKGTIPIYCAAHSWGGVLMLAYMARYENNIKNLVLFGAKRRLTIRSAQYYKELVFGWKFLGSILTPIFGYLPAKELKMGSDNEPRYHWKQINKWLGTKSKWVDNIDGFHYGKALAEKQLPPLLFLDGANDMLLGHTQDVKLLMNEVHNAKKEYWYLSKENGYKHNYGHVDMLTHKDAPDDYFYKIVNWMLAN